MQTANYADAVTEFRGQDLTGARFERVTLRNTTFTDAFLNGAVMRDVDLSGTQIRGAFLNDVHMRGVELVNVEINGELQNVVVNGVDIAPLVDAELNRRMPDRARCAPTTAMDSARRGQSWNGCGRTPSPEREPFPKRHSTAASMTSGPSPRPFGTSISRARHGWAG